MEAQLKHPSPCPCLEDITQFFLVCADLQVLGGVCLVICFTIVGTIGLALLVGTVGRCLLSAPEEGAVHDEGFVGFGGLLFLM